MTREKLGRKLEETLLVASRSWTWHFHSITMIELGWVIPFTGHITIGPLYHPYLGLRLPIHFSVTDMFKRSRSENSTTHLVSHPLQYIHAPFFHDRHPEPCIIRSFSPPKSFAPFRVVDVGFIKALLRQVTSCRHQLIIQEVDLGTTLSVLWSLHASMASFSLSVTSLHQWPSTERFYVVFNTKSFFTPRKLYCSTLRVIVIIGDSSRAS